LSITFLNKITYFLIFILEIQKEIQKPRIKHNIPVIDTLFGYIITKDDNIKPRIILYILE
jgi:hypothetical protein